MYLLIAASYSGTLIGFQKTAPARLAKNQKSILPDATKLM